MMYRCMGCMNEYDSNLSVCPHCNYARNSGAKEPYCLSPETVLDKRYIVGRVLSTDAFSIKYLGWDFAEECSVIIKEYFPKELSSRMPGQSQLNSYDGEKAKQFESGLKAFVEEGSHIAEISAGLEGIAKVKNVFVENSTAYIITEHPDGVSFKQVLEMGRLPWHDALSLVQPLIESLDYIHSNGLINYSIAPENIVMTRDRTMKLLDFGGSRFATVGNNKNLGLITTDGFSALELYRDDADTTSACDVYSIAAILYYAVTGVVPASAIERSASDRLKPPSQLGIEIPQNAENALMNALNVNVAYRTVSCGEFLSQLLSPNPVKRVVERKKLTDTGKWSKKTKVAVCLVALVVIGAIAAIFAFNSSPKNEVESEKATVIDFVENEYTLAKAKDWAKKNGITIVDKGDYPTADKGKAGKILWQSVEAGYKILESESDKFKIEVKIGKFDKDADKNANKKVKMPDLKGKTAAEAMEILEEAGFIELPKSGGDDVYSDDVAEGCIVSQSVKAGDEVTLGTQITYILSKGPEPTTTAAPTTEAQADNSGNSGNSGNNDNSYDDSYEPENNSGDSGKDDNYNSDEGEVAGSVEGDYGFDFGNADMDPVVDAGSSLEGAGEESYEPEPEPEPEPETQPEASPDSGEELDIEIGNIE